MEGWKKKFELKICFKQDLSCVCVCIIYSSWLNLFEIVWDFSWLWSLKDFCWKINYSGHWSFLLDCSRCTRLASEIDATALSGSTGLIPSNLVLMAPYSGHWLPTIRVVVPWLSSYQSTSNSKFNVYNCTPYTIIYIVILYNFQRNHALQERPWPATSPLWQKKYHYLKETYI